VHLSEVAGRASNAQQNVMVMGCFIENTADCTAKANAANSESAAKIQSGAITRGDFYIPFSLPDVLFRNAFTYFCAGILITWLAIFCGNLRVKEE